MTSVPRVSVLIPNWNGAHLLAELQPALEALHGCDFEVIIIDNGSTDSTREFLSRWPRARVLWVAKNTGFSGAVNRGLLAARGEYVLLLNNDMYPRPGFLSALVAAAVRHPEAGSFAARVLSRADPRRIDAVGDVLLASGRSRGRGRGEVDGPRFARGDEVFGGTGGAVLYRRSVLVELGGLDEQFFLYIEDTDLALRARLAGWSCRYVPEAVAEHVGSASMTGRNEHRALYCLRNHLLFLTKSYPWSLIVRYLPEVVVGIGREIRSAFGAVRAKRGAIAASREVGKAFAAALMLLPLMLWRRAHLVRRAEVSELASMVDGR